MRAQKLTGVRQASAPREFPGAAHEHEFEAQYGLPERLPPGERILWQGSPEWRVLARTAFHARKVAIYFALLLAVRFALLVAGGVGIGDALLRTVSVAPLPALGLALLLGMAWLSARTTVYTLTDRRLVLRIGIVLTMTFNVPLRRIESAGLRVEVSGHGDIPFVLKSPDRIPWAQLWPHNRPWHLRRPQPMLRAVPEAERVASTIARAWRVANEQAPDVRLDPRAPQSRLLPTTGAIPAQGSAGASGAVLTRGAA